MSRDTNLFVVTGRLTSDPTQKYSPDGKEISSFSIACNDSDEKVNFFNVEAWEKKAEIINQYCKKGSKILVTGRMNEQRWEKDGNKFSRMVIKLESFEFMGGKRDEE